MTGRRQLAVILRMILGMVAGSISIMSATSVSAYFWKLARARESSRKNRWTASSPCSLAALTMAGLVLMTPSARVFCRRNMTATSLLERPSTRSMWTMASLSAVLIRSTSPPTLHTLP